VEVVERCEDVINRECFENFLKLIEDLVNSRNIRIVDISGGRATMSFGIGIIASKKKIEVYTTQVSQEFYIASNAYKSTLKMFNIDEIYQKFKEEGCNAIPKNLMDEMKRLVSGEATVHKVWP